MRRALLATVAVLFSAGCKHLPPPTPLDQLNPQQTHGHEVFQAKCARCHNDRIEQALHGPSLMGVFKTPYLPSGAAATDERVTATMRQGRNLMPAEPLSPQDHDDLLTYLHTL